MEGVVFIGIAQEKAKSFKALKKDQKGPVGFEWSRQSVRVNHYYFYLQDADFGPGFIKVCSYIPYQVKVYLNGHEWAKQQLGQAGIGFEILDNGFLSCQEPEKLQAICDQLGPEQIQAFFDKWVARLPLPLPNSPRSFEPVCDRSLFPGSSHSAANEQTDVACSLPALHLVDD